MTAGNNRSARRSISRRSATTITALAAGAAFAVAPLGAATAAPTTVSATAASAATAAATVSGTDAFDRTVSNGWGTGGLGAWTLRDTASRYSVSNGSGVLTLKPGEGAKATTAPVAWQRDSHFNTDGKAISAKFTLANASQGSGQYVSAIVHEVGSKSIVVKAVAKPDGTFVLESLVNGVVKERSTVTEFRAQPGVEYTLSVKAIHYLESEGSNIEVSVNFGAPGDLSQKWFTVSVDKAFAAAAGSTGIEYYESGGAKTKGILKVDSFSASGATDR